MDNFWFWTPKITKRGISTVKHQNFFLKLSFLETVSKMATFEKQTAWLKKLLHFWPSLLKSHTGQPTIWPKIIDRFDQSWLTKLTKKIDRFKKSIDWLTICLYFFWDGQFLNKVHMYLLGILSYYYILSSWCFTSQTDRNLKTVHDSSD